MKLKFVLMLIPILLAVQNTEAQNSNKKLKITGYVIDLNDNPVVGALILIDGKNTGKVTNAKGYYKVKVNRDSKVLSVLTLNGSTTSIPIEGHTAISFVLDITSVNGEVQNINEPNELLETGYGGARRNRSTESSDKANLSQTDYSSYNNIYYLLQDKLPSVDVVVEEEKVYVRGVSTIIGGTEPLFIVDGVIMESISFISPNIVKSVDVLKGAAASMYGVRGSNGVIIINTIK